MLKNILIISSDFTGHGHKSITESLCEFFQLNDGVNIHVIDGFTLGGDFMEKMAKLYGPITRNVKSLWKLVWEVSYADPALINKIVQSSIRKSFLELLEKVKPDLILSVHPNFNGSVIDILENNDIKIPFVTLIADLVSISPLWADPRADYIICPTVEAKDRCIEFGVSESKVSVLGFPVRSRFYCDLDKQGENREQNSLIRCLLMSGGEGSGNMRKIAEVLLDNFNCTVKIVAGRNVALREKLEKSLTLKYGDRVEIYGFTKNVQDLMLASDIAITRGSPNAMMEAVSCNIPLIITGALPGQEEGNPDFAERYNLAAVCREVKKIGNTFEDLLANNREKLNQVKNSQMSYINPDIARNIVDFILNIDMYNDYHISSPYTYKIPQELPVAD